MTLDEAFELIWYASTRCDKRDVHTPRLREALHVILAAHPDAKRLLVEYWHATKFEPDLERWKHPIKTANIHPIVVGIERACKRPPQKLWNAMTDEECRAERERWRNYREPEL